MKQPLTQEQVERLGAAAINKALDSLKKKESNLISALIDAGFGRVGFQQILKTDHPVAQQYAQVNRQIGFLRDEIARRYGPGAPSRLPTGRGFGPIKKL